MKNDGKQYSRDLEGVADVVWDMVEKLVAGDKDFDVHRAELVIKGGETIVKAKMARIAIESHDMRMKEKGLKIINAKQQAGVIEHHDGRGEAGKAQGIKQEGGSEVSTEELGEGAREGEEVQ